MSLQIKGSTCIWHKRRSRLGCWTIHAHAFKEYAHSRFSFRQKPRFLAHVLSQSLSSLICCCLGLCHGWCWNSKILLSWQTFYCWELPHVSCRSGEISQGWAHILLSSSVAMMIAEQFIWISVKFVQKTCTYTCVHISVLNYKMTKKNFPHIHVFQNLFTVNMILILAVINFGAFVSQLFSLFFF